MKFFKFLFSNVLVHGEREALLLRSVLALGTLIVSSIAAFGSRPNVIVIFTDDHGYADLGVMGQREDIRTPNIDALAKGGALMTHGYVSAPQCIPSRAGLLTGRYQQRFGLDDNAYAPLPLEESTLADHLSQAGYRTGMSGKWHLEVNEACIDWVKRTHPEVNPARINQDIPFTEKHAYFPDRRGFQETFFGYTTRYWATHDLSGDAMENGATYIEPGGYRLDNQTEAALGFIDRNHREPFFLYLAYYAPHVPMEATEEYLSRFPGEMPTRRRYALAMLSAVDDGVGKVMERLRTYGIEENTLVFFISDNGAPLKNTKPDLPITFKGGAWDGSLNDPLVGEKGMLSEGGIRVPFIVYWLGHIPGGQVREESVITLDVAPTVFAAAGLSAPDYLDGLNLLPLLRENEALPERSLYWRFWTQSAIRKENWKYLKVGERFEYLFDLSSNEGERKNLIDSQPERAALLKKELSIWAATLHRPGIPEGKIHEQEGPWYDFHFSSENLKQSL